MWEYNDGRGDHAVRNRFTAWMEKVVKNLRIDYIRKKGLKSKKDSHWTTEMPDISYEQDFRLIPKDEFDFAEGKLAEVFAGLPLLRKRILVLTFVEELTAMEIAELLNCSVEYVYDQKRRALQKLRQQLNAEEDKK